MAKIMGTLKERFNKASPRKATLLDWERRVFAFGSVKDRPRSGRKKTREEPCAGVLASIEQSPIKSTCKRAAVFGIPRTTMQDHMKKYLKQVELHLVMAATQKQEELEQIALLWPPWS
ncbi:hypothetical protein C0J52_08118 [Blattella germanica]|nr:hypothetical protein C0J52_08118 [Blattella germanica]